MTRPLLTGAELFHSATASLDTTVVDFWRWAYSDLAANNTRALVAEFLVARALGQTARPRLEWDAVDVVVDGVKVEVKCAGYVQTWAQKKASAIRFDIASKLGWDAATNTSAAVSSRAADVYVFALHAHKERESLDVLDFAQWEFYVVARRTLDERLPKQRNASMATLIRIGATSVTYDALREAVLAAK